MKTIKSLVVLLGIFAFSQINAQEVTDYDLQNFARAYKEMLQLNNKAQKEMAQIISKEGMDLEVYHAINESKNSDYEPDVPKSEFTKYEEIQPEIEKVQNKLEQEVEKAYSKHDLSKQDYKAIAERVKQDQLLQIKLEKILSQI
ncbi:DUF4168 domain-containing protein [Moheibacter lacus]|uniref:DUF4168 domain-containing protein n=1 Tax=Moheibacter lacus TaxID=2745851 RepID=A0A838ZJ23_9FLAO|nr:DUF4168 domain-containing protein [Moheibacter lacus]MBA5629258.1 DUF4168 domain-containing protein [Moheibacter lacus]